MDWGNTALDLTLTATNPHRRRDHDGGGNGYRLASAPASSSPAGSLLVESTTGSLVGVGSVEVSGSLVNSEEDSSAVVATASEVVAASLVVSGEPSLVSAGSLVSPGSLVASVPSDDTVTTSELSLEVVVGVVVGVVEVGAAVVFGVVELVPAVVEAGAGGFTFGDVVPVVVIVFDTLPVTAASPSWANARSHALVSFPHPANGATTPPQQTRAMVPLGQKPGLRCDLACRGSLVFVIVSP